MQICLIGPAHPLRGGIANFNETLASAFHSAGHSTEIVSYSLQYPGFLFPGTTQFTEDEYKGKVSIRTLINSVNPLSWIRTGRMLRKSAPDIVIMHLWMPFFCPALGTIARLAKRNGKTKVFLLCHNVIPHEKKMGDWFLTKMLVPYCDGFISLSQSVLEDLSQFTNSDNKLFIPHPIYDIFGAIETKSEAKAALGMSPNRKYVLFFGMVRKYKGLDLLIDAFALFSAQYQDVDLLIAGEFYDNEEKYRRQIAEFGIADRVVIRNQFIPSEDVRHYFCASDIVAQTYITATQSGVTQIAYHFHRPMLVTNVGGLAEIVPESVGYITERTALDISDKLADFFNNGRESAMSAAAEREKARFGWDSIVDGFMALYQNCR